MMTITRPRLSFSVMRYGAGTTLLASASAMGLGVSKRRDGRKRLLHWRLGTPRSYEGHEMIAGKRRISKAAPGQGWKDGRIAAKRSRAIRAAGGPYGRKNSSTLQ